MPLSGIGSLQSPRSRQRATLLWANPIPAGARLGYSGAGPSGVSGGAAGAIWLWRGTLLLSGAPLMWQALRGILRGTFAADIVASLAILMARVHRPVPIARTRASR